MLPHSALISMHQMVQGGHWGPSLAVSTQNRAGWPRASAHPEELAQGRHAHEEALLQGIHQPALPLQRHIANPELGSVWGCQHLHAVHVCLKACQAQSFAWQASFRSAQFSSLRSHSMVRAAKHPENAAHLHGSPQQDLLDPSFCPGAPPCSCQAIRLGQG